ncbi:hypothetical protein [Salinigranum marinum]|nr:hypothetical protein [Salinigranum marinum]
MRQHRPWAPGAKPSRLARTTTLDRRRIAHPLVAAGGFDVITGESA